MRLLLLDRLYDHVSSRRGQANPNNHSVSVGGVLAFQQLNLPPPAKQLKGDFSALVYFVTRQREKCEIGGWLLREENPLSASVSVLPYNAGGNINTQPQVRHLLNDFHMVCLEIGCL